MCVTYFREGDFLPIPIRDQPQKFPSEIILQDKGLLKVPSKTESDNKTCALSRSNLGSTNLSVYLSPWKSN